MFIQSFDLLKRLLDRCTAAYNEAEIHPEVKSMYEDVLATPADTYRSAYLAFPVAVTLAQMARVALSSVMATADKEFSRVRAIVVGRFPATVVPATLKQQATPTEQKSALEALLALVTGHRGEAWADTILAGTFGSITPDAIAKLAAVITADTKVAKAREARSTSAEPAYRAYLQFKEVLRYEPGPGGRFYRWLKVPASVTAVQTGPTVDPPEVSASPEAATLATAAPTNGVSH